MLCVLSSVQRDFIAKINTNFTENQIISIISANRAENQIICRSNVDEFVMSQTNSLIISVFFSFISTRQYNGFLGGVFRSFRAHRVTNMQFPFVTLLP